jgi:hypothetical protein
MKKRLLFILLLLPILGISQINDTWDAVNIGSTQCGKIYSGSTLVWEKPTAVQGADYLVVRYIWESSAGADLDTGTEFTNSGISGLDDDGVGYGLGYTTTDSILTHAGDNTTSGDESFFIDINKLKTTYYSTIPTSTNIDLYGTWFDVKLTGDITIEIKSYEGGTMSKSGFTWVNTGGVNTSTQTINTVVSSTINYSSTWRTDYTYLGNITYNKVNDTSIFSL